MPTNPFGSIARGGLAVLVALSLAQPAFAQDRLIVHGRELGTHGHFGQKLGDAPPWIVRAGISDAEWVGGGRYLLPQVDVGPSDAAVEVRAAETLTGREVALPAAVGVVGDPIRPRVFVLDGSAIQAVSLDTGVITVLGQARSWTPPPPGPFTPPPAPVLPMARYAQNGDRLFVRRANGAGTGMELAVLDGTTGALVRTLPAPPSVGSFQPDWIVSADGSRLYAVIYETLAPGTTRAFDTTTGAEVAATPATGRLRWDDTFQRVLILANGETALRVFDRDLVPLGTLPGGFCVSNARTSPHTGRIYHLRAAGGGGGYYGPIDTRLVVHDGQNGRLLADASVTDAAAIGTDRANCSEYTMLLATAPGAPRGLSAAVSGHDVTLAWTNVGDASNAVLDVGLAPGRTDLTFSIGSSSPATIAGAPSGTYYLRVRGTNAFGASRASNEVVVVVP